MVSAARVRLLAKYGLTPEGYERILAAQGGKCAICRRLPKPGKNFNVDHDHKTDAVRGLLCFFCNRILLGRRREDAGLHLAAYLYLAARNDWRDMARVPDPPRVRRQLRHRRVQVGVVPAPSSSANRIVAPVHHRESASDGTGDRTRNAPTPHAREEGV